MDEKAGRGEYVLTTSLHEAQRRAECMMALRIEQAAGERLRSEEGTISRCSGRPRVYPVRGVSVLVCVCV